MSVTISLVTGTVAQGNTLTISGSELVKENLTGALSFFTDATYGAARKGEGGSDGQALSAATAANPLLGWVYGGGGDGTEDAKGGNGFIDTSKKLQGTRSFKFNSIEGSFPGGGGTGQSYNYASISGIGTPNEYYGRQYFKLVGVSGWPRNYSKLIYNNGNFYIDFGGSADGSTPFTAFNFVYAENPATPTLTVNHFVSIAGGSPITEDKWYCLEWHFKQATAGNANGIFQIWLDGVEIHNAATANLTSLSLLLIGTINAGGTVAGQSWGFKTWIDNIIAKTSRVFPSTIVELSDNSSYGAGTLLKQELLSISDSQIQFICDLTGLGAGPYYLYVRNNSQEQSASFNISGGGSCSAPTNIDAPNAIAITSGALPYQAVQDVHCSGTTYTVWYKYTESVRDRVIGFRFWGTLFGDSSTYRPTVEVYKDEAATIFIGSLSANLSSQLPIANGDTYWFKIITNSGNPSPAVLTVDMVSSPNLTINIGNVFIRAASIDNSQIAAGFLGLPGGIIDVGGSSIINFQNFFITGESGDVISSGRMLFADEYGSAFGGFPGVGQYYVALYENDFSFISNFVFDSPLLPPIIKAHIPTSKFYVFSSRNATGDPEYVTVDSSGTASSPIALTGAGAAGAGNIAVNNAETIMYIPGVGSSNFSNIKRWDLSSSGFLSDLSPLISGYRVADLLVLPDDSIVVVYLDSSIPRNAIYRRYDTSGTILNTYSITIGGGGLNGFVVSRLGNSSTSGNFWLLSHTVDGYNDVREIRASDGAIIQSSLTPNSTYAGIEQFDPDLIVTSDTCPIIELRASGGGGTTGTIRIDKIVVPSSDPAQFTIDIGGVPYQTETTLSHGQSETLPDLVAQSGYSVVEQSYPLYTTEYTVSNDPSNDNTNITVGEGELVVVTITNTIIPEAGSGMYKLTPGKRNDTLWVDVDAETTTDVKIPDPYIKTGLIGS